MDGFNTFEKQDKVLLGLNSGRDAAAALRILQQQGFAVQTFTAENAVTPAELLRLLADKAAELDCAFIATGHYARIEVDSEGLSRVLAAEDAEADQSSVLADLPRLMQALRVPAIGMAVVERGEVVWARNLGVTNAETRAPVADDTRWRCSSIDSWPSARALSRTAQVSLRSVSLARVPAV